MNPPSPETKHDLLLFYPPEADHPFAAIRLDHGAVDLPEPDGDETFYQRTRRRLHHAYQALKDRLDHQERVCSALRHAPDLTVHHAKRLSEERARRVWDDYLFIQRSRHRRWLALYTVLAILGLALIPIPGPNVFSAYPAALGLGRLLALRGIRSARQSAIIFFEPEPLLDVLEGSVDRPDLVRDKIRILEERFGVNRLEELLAKQ